MTRAPNPVLIQRLAAIRMRAAALLVLTGIALPALAQQDSLTRTTAFTYNPTNGLLEKEIVDPGGSHCVETAYVHDQYGNRQTVTVRPCTSTTTNERFTTRVTTNEFQPGTGYPEGAYLTRSRSGALPVSGTGINVMSQAEATFNAKYGAAATATEVALGVANGTRNLTKRTTFDTLGRVAAEYVPVKRNGDNTVVESRVEYAYVYCLGPKAPPTLPAACLNITNQSVSVTYDSQRLVNTDGTATTTATVSLKSAYYIESTPKNGSAVIGVRSRVHYDSLHREFAKEAETYDGKWSRTMTGFDQLGMTAVTWGAHFSDAGAAELNEQRQWTSQRDLLHRPTVAKQMWRGENGVATAEVEGRVEYNGLTSTAIVPGGSAPGGIERRRITRKNAAGQTAQTVDPLGATLTMAYDGFGNLVQTVDPLGYTTTISYTATTARFKIAMTDPDKGSWSYKYDALGQLKQQTDGNLKTTTLAYDALGRLTDKDTGSFNANWRFSVNDLGALWSQDAGDGTVTCADGLARLCQSFTGDLTPDRRTIVAYDNLGRAKRSTIVNEGTYVSQTAFDDLGRVDTYKYPSGITLKHTYSTESIPSGKKPGFLVTVADSATPSRQFWSIADPSLGNVFDSRGMLVKSKLGNGVTTTNVFDPVSGKAFALQAGNGGSTNNVLNQAYTYDKANNLSRRSNGFSGGNELFVYDLLDRLTSYAVEAPNASANRTVTVSYNALGNILSKTDVGGYYYNGTRPHAVSTAGGTSYSYDGNGNLVGSTGVQSRTHTWTDFNRPNTMAFGGTTLTFGYDETAKRVKESFVSGNTERRLWLMHPDNAGGLSFEREETIVGGVITRNENRHYISVGGATVAVVKTTNANVAGAMTTNAEVSDNAELTHYWHKDSLGSIVAVTNGAAAILERPAFDAWGRRLLDSGFVDNSASGPAHGDRGYTGHEHLDELGLIHMNGRIYDPVLARFLSPDPLNQSPENLQNYNAYSYVLNNPLKYTDPSGEFIPGIVWFIVGAIMAHEGNQYWGMVGRIMMMWSLVGQGGLVAEAGLGADFAVNTVGNAAASAAIATAASPGSSPGDIFSAGLFGGAFAAVGLHVATVGGRLAMHALLGCVQGASGGGKCGPSAMAAVVGKGATEGLDYAGVTDKLVMGIVTGIAGGTASVIGGGKFANGAFQAGFGYLFNKLATHRGDPGDAMSPESNPARGMSDTAGDVMGLKVLGYGLGGVSLVGVGAMAVSYALAAPVGEAVFYAGFGKYAEGITLAAAAAGTPIFNTPLGRAMTSIQARFGSDLFWGRAWDAASAGYAHYAQGTVKVLEWVRNSASTFRRIELPILQRNGNQIVNVPPPGP